MSYVIGSFSRKARTSALELSFTEHKLETPRSIIYFEKRSLQHFRDRSGHLKIISGTGLSEDLELLDITNWKAVLENEGNLRNFNGHFIIISETSQGLEIFNDQLGLREVYFYETNDQILFSTRLDWLLKSIKSPRLNFNYLSSYWNFENPLVYETFCKGVKLLGPGGKATITEAGLKIENEAWKPSGEKLDTAEIIELLDKLLNSILTKYGKLNLGLSGGLDSRSILTLLFKYEKKFWSTHTFGQEYFYDVKIANRIAQKFKLDHFSHSRERYRSADVFGSWIDFVKETSALLPADTYHELGYYKLLPQDVFFIDGGKGEYLRRGLSNRLAVLGKKALQEGNITELKKYLSAPKPAIFNKDVTANWEQNLNSDLSNLLQTMPEVEELGVDNWVDLYNIRYRSGNAGYPSQTRLDSIVRNLMPFIQPKILSAVLNLPAKLRKKEKLNSKILDHKRALKLFPLARYDTIIPFQHNKYTCLLWGKLMRTFFKDKLKNRKDFITNNRDYLLSRISDVDFINDPIYNKELIKNKIENFFGDEQEDVSFVIWWMTFDVWRKMLK